MASMKDTKFKTVEEYLSTLPSSVKALSEDLRRIIKQTAPEAEEIISYNMPAYRFHGILVYFAAHKEHIGFYPGSSVTTSVFKDELTKYKTSKGTVQFPIDKPIPVTLVKKIVKYRMKENLEKEKAKAEAKAKVKKKS